jgi:hypothetical protein
MPPKLVRLASLFLALVPCVSASETCHSYGHPATYSPWSQTIVVPKHDPAMGPLESVTIVLRGRLEGSFSFENLVPCPDYGVATSIGRLFLRRPDASTLVVAEPAIVRAFDVGAFDGTVDFGGESGVTYP